MKEQAPKRRTAVSFFANIVLLLVGMVAALGLVELFMRTFPNLVPGVRVNPPARRVKAFIDETYDVRRSDGDLYHLMDGKIVPLAPDQDQVVAQVHMVTDANGFRNVPVEKDEYDMVALGDSFTKASAVASAWPQLLADQTGSDVLNLGDVAFGPQDELKVLRQYGLETQAQWVILAYFGGNDIYDAGAYEQATPFIIARLGRYVFNRSVRAWAARQPDRGAEVEAAPYRYPIMVTIDNKELEINFFNYYISWLSVDGNAIRSSRNYPAVTETILKMQELSDGAGARFLLVYVPSKERVYLPFVQDADTLRSVFLDVPTIAQDQAGYLQFGNEKATPEYTLQHMDDQPTVLADFAAQHSMFYLDLTSTFEEHAGRGEELYYVADTHWNQNGHDLAAKTIAQYIQDVLLDTASNNPGN